MIAPYLKALKAEIKRYLPQPRLVSSIFFGGGTPSYLPPELLADLLLFIKENFCLSHNVEVTIEANPGTIKGSELPILKSAGFNRLSIGLQACQDHLLKGIGRIHSWDDFLNIFEAGRAAGITNIGTDLIFGLPEQSLQDWRETLERVVSLGPDHISAYGLQLEPGTRLALAVEQGLARLPSEDDSAEMMSIAMSFLPKQGYRHYEISNYARPGFHSIHNLGYWRGCDYLGFGAGAYSTVGNQRWCNLKEPEIYIDTINKQETVIGEDENLDFHTRAMEALMLGLRLRAGVNLEEYEAEYGTDLLKTAGSCLAELLDLKLINIEGKILSLTNNGVLLSNRVIGSLLAYV